VLRVLEAGRVVGIFPEGPFSQEGRLVRGQPGAAMIALRAGVPIVPAAIEGTYEALRARRFYVPRRQRLSVRFGEPLQRLTRRFGIEPRERFLELAQPLLQLRRERPLEEPLHFAQAPAGTVVDTAMGESHSWDYIYEPDAKEVLDGLLTRYIEALIYQAVAENMASEQSARMVAMKAASDNAADIIDELTLVLNKTRQAAITTELAEIVGGAAAV